MSEYRGFPSWEQQSAERGLVAAAFRREDLARVCEMHESEFGVAYDMEEHVIAGEPWPDNYFFFKDNDSDILAVAHLDTVVDHGFDRKANIMDTADGPVIFSGALDDRLGAWIILHLLPALGVNVDVLLTVGEESGCSTAQHFTPPEGKDYLWGIEFDRGDTDVVMYQYEDHETRELVRECGARVGTGSFSDIAYLEHLEVKMFNWGVAYRDYHGPRGHAWLNDTFDMVAKFLRFHTQNVENYLPHDDTSAYRYSYQPRRTYWWDEPADEDAELRERCDRVFGVGHFHDETDCRYTLDAMDTEDSIDALPAPGTEGEALVDALVEDRKAIEA